MKESYDIPAKTRVRKQFRRFIKKNFKDTPKKILCLAGHEAIEITAVYKALGFEMDTITTCEINKESYEKLIEKKLGIKVFYGDVNDFVSNTNEKFDIINLDFCGNLNNDVAQAISKIFQRELLNDGGILGCTFLARREKEGTKKLYKMPFVIQAWSDLSNAFIDDDEKKVDKIYSELQEIQEDDDIYRDGIPRIIMLNAFAGNMKVKYCGEEIENAKTFPEMVICLKRDHMSRADDEQKRIKFNERMNKCVIANNAMLPTRMEFYKYKSDNGSPMLTLFFKFQKAEKLHRQYGEYDFVHKINQILRGKTMPQFEEIETPKTNGNQNGEIIVEVVTEKTEEIKKGEVESMAEKQEEGVAIEEKEEKDYSKIPPETIQQIVRALKEGLDKEQVARIFGVKFRQVSAIRAHITMGNYQ